MLIIYAKKSKSYYKVRNILEYIKYENHIEISKWRNYMHVFVRAVVLMARLSLMLSSPRKFFYAL